MAVKSKIKSAFSKAKSVLAKAKSVLSSLLGGSTTASVGSSITAKSTPQTINLPTQTFAPDPADIAKNIKAGGGVPSSTSGGGYVNPYGGQVSTISAGKIPNIDYTFRAGETVSSYNARIAQARQTAGIYTGGLSGVISAASLSDVSSPSLANQQFNVPTTPITQNLGAINNAGLAQYDPNTGAFIGSSEQPIDTEAQRRQKTFEDLLGVIPEQKSAEEDREVRRQRQVVQEREQEVNNLTSQLNSIVAKQKADLLNLRQIGSEEGVTETVYGGQEATINREAAIKALPIQAQLATAQGSLELAQNYLSELRSIKQDQLDREYSYNMAVFSATRDFLTSEEKIRLDKIEKAETRAYNETSKNNNTLLDWMEYAATNGQANLISQLKRIDPRSSNFVNELANVVGQVKAKSTETKIATSVVNSLLSAGYTESEATVIDRGVRSSGLRSVIEAELSAGTDTTLVTAIANTYGASGEIYDLIDNYGASSKTVGGFRNWWNNLWN